MPGVPGERGDSILSDELRSRDPAREKDVRIAKSDALETAPAFARPGSVLGLDPATMVVSCKTMLPSENSYTLLPLRITNYNPGRYICDRGVSIHLNGGTHAGVTQLTDPATARRSPAIRSKQSDWPCFTHWRREAFMFISVGWVF